MSKEGRPFTRFTPSRSIPSSIQKESGNSEFAFTGLYTCTSQIRSAPSKAMDPVQTHTDTGRGGSAHKNQAV